MHETVLVLMMCGAPDATIASADLGVRACVVQSISLDHMVSGDARLSLQLDDRPATFECSRWSNRRPGYQVLEDLGGGRYRRHAPSPIKTWRGVSADGDLHIAFSEQGDRVTGLVLAMDGTQWWIEPLEGRTGGAGPGDHAVFRGEDADRPKGMCGTEAPSLAEGASDDDGWPLPPPRSGEVMYTAEFVADADFEFYEAYGSVAAVESRINTVMNGVNLQYETQCNITHSISTIMVRTGDDPYSTNDIYERLNQVWDEWDGTHPEIARDVVHLFSGESFAGSTIGLAYVSAVCSSSEYGVVESDCCGTLACAVDLSSHELGHNWGARHCSCPDNTMHASLSNCTATFTQASIDSITSYRDSISGCLDTNEIYGACCRGDECDIRSQINCAAAGGTFQGEDSTCDVCGGGGGDLSGDTCADAIVVSEGATAFSSISASDSGVDPPDDTLCGSGWGWGGDDLWFSWTPTDSGEAVITTCDSASFDTSMAVYTGGCNGLSQQSCNGDGSGDLGCQQYYSRMELAVQAGEELLIRVAGYGAGDVGVGTLNIDLTPDGVAVGDICMEAIPAGVGETAFNSTNATNSGVADPEGADCGDDWDWNGYDIWFRWTSSRSGHATISTCDSASFDTSLVLYDGACNALSQLACNGDAVGGPSCQSYWSEIEMDVVSDTYFVRIAGWDTADTGPGTLTITFDVCVGDLTGDGTVGVADLSLLLGLWGVIAPAYDLDDSGGPVSVGDLLTLLDGWGGC